MPSICGLFTSGTVCAVTITTGAKTVFVETAPVSLVGDQVAPHGEPPHSSSFIVNGSGTVFVEGRPITLVGSGTTCGHPITFGSSTVFAGF